jgi:hypothetical protein
MVFWEQLSLPTVARHGASAGCILCGCGGNNQGLRLRILQDQQKGNGGPIVGDFVILDVGDNRHSNVLAELLLRTTNAQEVLRLIRGQHSACVSVVNGNILSLEQAGETKSP